MVKKPLTSPGMILQVLVGFWIVTKKHGVICHTISVKFEVLQQNNWVFQTQCDVKKRPFHGLETEILGVGEMIQNFQDCARFEIMYLLILNFMLVVQKSQTTTGRMYKPCKQMGSGYLPYQLVNGGCLPSTVGYQEAYLPLKTSNHPAKLRIWNDMSYEMNPSWTSKGTPKCYPPIND